MAARVAPGPAGAARSLPAAIDRHLPGAYLARASNGAHDRALL